MDGTLTRYLLDGGNVVAEITDSAVTATYLRGMNLISRTIGESTNYYLYNAHGDVVQLTNSTGTVTKTYSYDAFGNETNRDETDTNPFRYCGEYFDTETGTYYLRARYYDPVVGRFTQSDSVLLVTHKMPNGQEVIDPLSLNLYTYCANNPVAYHDPSGHYWETILDILGFCLSARDYIKDPTQANLAFLLWDVFALAAPIPGSYAASGIKAVGKLDDVHDSGKLAEELLVALFEVANSKTLRKNMIEAGVQVPKYKNAAHHIVAGGAGAAEEARAILQKFGIGINHPANGVFLPTVKGVSDAAYHPGLHTTVYYNTVTELLREATTREEALEILKEISEQLQEGTFPK